jgi:hypothetical protein
MSKSLQIDLRLRPPAKTAKINQELTRFPDEDKIEDVQDRLYEIAWNTPQPDPQALRGVVDGIREILSIWDKILASQKLSQIISSHYLNRLEEDADGERIVQVLRQIDLIICFFHHYIYAFDEFVNRKFRNSVIRCGLICERIVKRLALAANKRDVLDHPKFEARVNRLRTELEGSFSEATDLANFLQYVYRQRTAKGAHDTKAATALIAKSCMTTAPTVYLLYLEALEHVGHKIEPKDELLELVNSTIITGTRLVLAQEGQSIRPKQVLESLYKGEYFALPRTLAEVRKHLNTLGYNFPNTTLFGALETMSRKEEVLMKDRGAYLHRIPPSEYFKKEIVE